MRKRDVPCWENIVSQIHQREGRGEPGSTPATENPLFAEPLCQELQLNQDSDTKMLPGNAAHVKPLETIHERTESSQDSSIGVQ